MSNLILGDILEKRYKVVSFLGSGGMSQVYLVKDLRLDNHWVLKEFAFGARDRNEKKQMEQNFITEAKFCARLSHVGIPRVVDYFTANNRHYLVEEYVEGESLLNAIKLNKINLNQALQISLMILDVLAYIHGRGIVYRDLKADNVIIRHDGSIKLIDFGIARLYKRGKDKDTVIMGTPGYASPEQYGTTQTDQRSDIYSLGALLHHMVTRIDPRDKPFHFDPPNSVGANIPAGLESVIMKALSIKAQDRFQSARSMKKALESVLDEMEKARNTVKTPPVSKSQAVHLSRQNPSRASPPSQYKKHVPGQSEKEKPVVDHRARVYQKVKEKVAVVGETGDNNLARKIIGLTYTVLFVMVLALMVEFRFRVWVLIPYFLLAWVMVLILYSLWGGKKPRQERRIHSHIPPDS